MSKIPFSAVDLKPNHVYLVIAPFKDFDGVVHPPESGGAIKAEITFPTMPAA